MNFKRFVTLIAGFVAVFGMVSAQSYYDDDIYFDASKAPKQANVQKPVTHRNSTVIVYDYPSADNYTVTSGGRKISVDDYNRRGIFATDSLTADTTATDFAYTRRIEQFYNPQIVSGSGDQELANIYYMEPDQVNIYVNTPSAYWGYDYFAPYGPAWGSPYWYNNYWRWNSSWYWGSWYDPYWAWNWGWGPSWGWGPAWGPSWGWGPGWGWAGPAWGWSSGPKRAPNLLAGHRPGGTNSRPVINARPNVNATNGRPNINTNGRYPSTTTNSRPNINRQPTTNNSNSRPNTNTNNYNRPTNNTNTNYNYTPNSIGGRYGTGSYGTGSFGGSRGSGGGGRSSGGGGRGRH